ncbi:hypothetical protein SUGI_0271800 [Cryptomeria japonica]|nr:hypothetical protein SUGI_0271800 [Cryptomeria japonica]
MRRALFLFKFISEEDVVMVLSGCWTYGKCNLSLCRWKASFDLTADLHKFAMVWVFLHGLLLEYWDDSVFIWIGNTFGNFVGVDEITKTKSKLVYALFYVEATINKNILNFISLKCKLGSWTHALVYENATLFYQKSCKACHIISECKEQDPNPLKLKGPIVEEGINKDSSSMECIVEDYPFTESINNLLYSPAKGTDGAPNSLLDLDSMLASKMVNKELGPSKVLISSPFKVVTPLEEGEIVAGSSTLISPGSIRSPPEMLLLKGPSYSFSMPDPPA